MLRRAALTALVAALLAACSVKSTPAWRYQLEACKEIEDEALRVECITGIEAGRYSSDNTVGSD